MSTTSPIFLEDEQLKREYDLDKESKEETKQPIESNDVFESQNLTRKTLLAAEKNRLLDLSRLIAANPQVVNNTDNDNYTPLHRASYGGNIDCVKYLLRHGANIDAKTNDLWTPLHCACRWNNLEVAEYLIKKGADVNAQSDGGNTPLHIVASNGRYSITCDIIQLLLYHPKCDFRIKNSSGDTAYDIAKRSGPFYKLWTGVMTLPDEADACT